MTKTYERPVLQTKQFDAEDVITTSAVEPAAGTLGTTGANWEVTNMPISSEVNFH